MNAFEALIALLLRRQGYWVQTSFKVKLTKAEKRRIGRPSSPRWELDLVAYKGAGNEILAIECKSYLDSPGVLFREGKFQPAERYKLFTDSQLRRVVLRRLAKQLESSGSCAPGPTVRLCLAAGNVAAARDLEGLRAHFETKGWRLFAPDWIQAELRSTSTDAYENDVALVVAKLLLRAK